MGFLQMTPIKFPEANAYYGPPPDMTAGQCGSIDLFRGRAASGSLDGAPVIVTAWRPDARELTALNAGGAVFLTFVGTGLPPHCVTTSFEQATNPA
jgi:hypothetical protein